MPVPARQALRRLLPYYHPYRGQVAAGLVMVVTGAALSTLIPAVLRRGLDSLRAGADARSLIPIAGLMLAIAATGGLFRFGMRKILNGVSRRIETDLRNDLFGHLLDLDAAWYTRWRTGDIMARLTNDLSAVRMAAGPAIMYLVNTIAGGIFAIVMMVEISATLTMFSLLPMVGLPLLMLRLGRIVHRRFEAVQSQFSRLTTHAQENLSGVRVVRAYRQEDSEAKRFAALGEEYLKANMKLAVLNGIMHPGFAMLAGFGSAVALGVGGYQLIEGRITVGGFVAFNIYLAMLTWPLIALGWTTNLLQRGAASMSRVLEILDSVPHVRRADQSRTLPAAAAGRSIEFRHVWFRYPTLLADGSDAPVAEDTAPRWVLRDISFRIPAGGTLAIVGATGAGKSALMDLVPRLFDADRGEILVDDVPIQQLAIDELRREIGYVPQESLLFSETIGANVAYGVTDIDWPVGNREAATATPMDANGSTGVGTLANTGEYVAPAEITPQMVEATQVAQLTETISELPDGYATILGERGINLSGGQKQRTSLARALARRPHIVMLDDALSAVDTHTEAAILGGLRSALAGRTAIIASHRVSTVRDADLILVLEDGAIVEQGRHDELVALGGRYATLLRRQQMLEAIESN